MRCELAFILILFFVSLRYIENELSLPTECVARLQAARAIKSCFMCCPHNTNTHSLIYLFKISYMQILWLNTFPLIMWNTALLRIFVAMTAMPPEETAENTPRSRKTLRSTWTSHFLSLLSFYSTLMQTFRRLDFSVNMRLVFIKYIILLIL